MKKRVVVGNYYMEKKDRVIGLAKNSGQFYEFSISKEDLDKVKQFTWEAHLNFGSLCICHRYQDANGKFNILYLSRVLGYPGHTWVHKNGDNLDFRRSNMIKKEGCKTYNNGKKSIRRLSCPKGFKRGLLKTPKPSLYPVC